MTRPDMPLLMQLGGWCALAFAVGSAAVLGLAAVGIGAYGIAGRPVATGEWLRLAGPLFVVCGGLMAGIAYGFRARKRWSRHLAMAFWTAFGLYALAMGVTGRVPSALMWRALIEAVGLGAIAAWYFYRKPEVVDYFRRLD